MRLIWNLEQNIFFLFPHWTSNEKEIIITEKVSDAPSLFPVYNNVSQE